MYSSRHFNEQQVLFPNSEKELNRIIEDAEKVESEFNDPFGRGSGQRERIDLERVRQGLTTRITRQAADMVDLAKEEALGRMGER